MGVQQMTYITSVERIGIEKGLEIGRQEGRQEGRREGLQIGLVIALEMKFGEAGRVVAEELRQIEDDTLLLAVAERLKTATTIEELRALYQSSGA